MHPIHLVALDMDGTLLNDKKQITQGTAEALRMLRDRGIHAALCTGRAYPEVTLFEGLTDWVPYGILASGALVCRFAPDKVIAAGRIQAEAALEALDRAGREDIIPHLLTDTQSVIREGDIERLAAHHMGAYAPMFRQLCVKTRDLPAFIRDHPDSLFKLNFYHTGKEERARNEQRLAGLPFSLLHAEYSSLECTAPGVAKDSGLNALCRELGIGPENVLAVGDSENDIPMLKLAGVPVCMGNAPEAVRKWARYTTLDNDHDGAAAAIREYLPQMTPPGGR